MTMWKHQDARQILMIGCPGILLIAVAISLFVFALVSGRAISLYIWLLALLGVVLVVWMGLLLRQQDARVDRYQKKRDNRAVVIRELVLAGKQIERPYFVYLRPFDIDNKFFAAPSGIPSDYTYIEEFGWPTAKHDLESALANMVYASGLLVAVSDKPGDAGPAHVTANGETWQKDVFALCNQAAGIFMVPFDYEGTAWEVNMLVDAGWLDKTFFIMPEEQVFARRLGMKRMTRDYRMLWEEGRKRYTNLALPPYQKQGLIFQLMEGQVKRYQFGSARPFAGQADTDIGDIEALRARFAELAEQSQAQR
jgi:hypothetical protein